MVKPKREITKDILYKLLKFDPNKDDHVNHIENPKGKDQFFSIQQIQNIKKTGEVIVFHGNAIHLNLSL
jgi:hypothetical protein